jgi:acyl carrier protein
VEASVTAVEDAVAHEILGIVRDEVGFAGEPPEADEPLASRLDSLMLLSLVVAVEDRFHVVLTDDDAADVRTVADLARIVAARAGAGRRPGAEASP